MVCIIVTSKLIMKFKSSVGKKKSSVGKTKGLTISMNWGSKVKVKVGGSEIKELRILLCWLLDRVK